MTQRALSVTIAALLWIPVAAGGTITVGPPGSGANYHEIQPAIDAAAVGDVIRITPLPNFAGYQPFMLDKGLFLFGEPDFFVEGTGAPASVLIDQIPADQTVALSGMRTEGAEVLVQNSLGSIFLENLDLWSLRIEASANVEIAGLYVIGIYDANCVASIPLTVVDSRVSVADLLAWGAPNPGCGDHAGGKALQIERSTVVISGNQNDWILGGSGVIQNCFSCSDYACSHVGPGALGNGGDTITAIDSEVVILGPSSFDIYGGMGGYGYDEWGWGCSTASDGKAITGSNSDVLVSGVSLYRTISGVRFRRDDNLPFLRVIRPAGKGPGAVRLRLRNAVDVPTMSLFVLANRSAAYPMFAAFSGAPLGIGFDGWYTVVVGAGQLTWDFDLKDPNQVGPYLFQVAAFGASGRNYLTNTAATIIEQESP